MWKIIHNKKLQTSKFSITYYERWKPVVRYKDGDGSLHNQIGAKIGKNCHVKSKATDFIMESWIV